MDEENKKDLAQDWEAAFEEANKAKAATGGDSTDLDWDAAFAEVQAAGGKQKESALKNESMPFDDFGNGRPARASDRSLDFLLDIPLEVSVELGRTRMVIGDLLKMGQGAIIELNRLAGEPVDVFVNGKMLGKGEVVVADEKFGVRLTEIISPTERIKSLS